ncbi:MAG TPA: AraC family ligand binding domain-containing protein [Bryobacteraceae bacterium]|nr:AraC family ligand binding domain-containing protein [Bryobacteraceae bacterium]
MTTALTFIDTNKLPRVKTPQGEVTEILNQQLEGAKNVFGTLRWLAPGEKFDAAPLEKHQLIYLMEGQGSVRLENKNYDIARGAGVYLGPAESATIQAGAGSPLKLFHLIVPRIPAN